ncbi:MAG: sensor histidine kinase [Treponema sp.]|nr:sensor histidine kinase [Treponema sp.]
MRKKPSSIRINLWASYIVIICFMMIPAIYSIITFRLHTSRYDRIIANASLANQLRYIAKVEIEDEIWDIVAGLIPFNEGRQYSMLREVRVGIASMKKSSERTGASKELLNVAARTEKTLEKYVSLLETQITNNASVADNQDVMDQIRSVSSLLDDILQEFIMSEIESAAKVNNRIHRASMWLSVIQIIVSALALIVAIYASNALYRIIRKPISDMETHSSRIASGDLAARVERPNVIELDHLAANLNVMAVRIQELINENIKEQKNLQKAEMRTLQAQITPHFLYNTFDTIIWLAESEETEEVIEITKAFSQFFRISLSKGHDWINVEQELEHVKSYLTIQKIRYANILSYDIVADEGIESVPMLKLLLQPLVENAIYHGIKNKRGRGRIVVEARKVDAFGLKEGGIYFSVSDDGIGFTPERLTEVWNELHQKADTENLTAVYGLYNVHKRLELYYDKKVSFFIESEYGKGTRISFTVPVNVSVSEEYRV